MPAEEHATARPTLRERRRAAAVREILEAAERQIAEDGPAALSLRAVARSLGMTVQALYHYFPKREALVTSLVAKEYEDLADALQAALDGVPDSSDVPRLVAATEGYRRWAMAHPERFQLLFGTPLRGYAAPAEGATTKAMRRIAGIFQRELFDGFSREQLAAADTSALSPELLAHLESLPAEGPGELPPPAIALFVDAWGRVHGLVVLEVFGQTSFIGDGQAEIFRMAMAHMLQDVHRRIPAAVSAPA
ncbi:TetR/AcrR family transcriptional regulator [Streptomyces sp. NPDC088194]|uniref:TetR/AcrR family transcriptional regulator n=1 Tax=Streptomyces sp. NPDC088194 TaxID=3154931 RepID=UPI00344F7A7A